MSISKSLKKIFSATCLLTCCQQVMGLEVMVPGGGSVLANQSLSFSTETNNAVQVSDDFSNQQLIQLSVNYGVLSLAQVDGLTFVLGDGSADQTVSFRGTELAVNTALNGLNYLPSDQFTGIDELTVELVGVDGTPKVVKLAVNAAVDFAVAREEILRGVSQVAHPITNYTGHMAVYGPSAFAVGHNGDYRPIMSAATWGKGRVFAFGRTSWNEWNDQTGAGDMDTLYANLILWTTENSAKNLKIVVDHKDTVTWLVNNGYTNVSKYTDWENYLSGADLLVTVIEENPSPARQDALEQFVTSGGGLIVSGYGKDWSETNTALTNKLFQACGLGWTPGYTVHGQGAWDLAVATDYANAYKMEEIVANRGMATEAQIAETAQSLNEFFMALSHVDWAMQEMDALLKPHYSVLMPSPENGIDDTLDRALLEFESRFLLTAPIAQVSVHRTAHYHGIVTPEMARVSKTVTVSAPPQNDLREDISGVGLYVPPGEVVDITLPASLVNLGLKVQVGHQYVYRDYNTMPNPIWSFEVDQINFQVGSAYGGLLFFRFPAGFSVPSFTATISGCVEAPRFVLGETTDSDWISSQRDLPGPSAEFLGTNHRIIAPTALVKTLNNPSKVMQLRNDIFDKMYYLAGYDRPDEIQNIFWALDPRNGVSINPLYAPAEESAILLTDDYLDFGKHWVYMHEFGHRVDDGAVMVRSSNSESYNNMIGLYALEALTGRQLAKQYAKPEGQIKLFNDFKVDAIKWDSAPHHQSRPKTAFGTILGQFFGWENYRSYSVQALADRPVDDQAKTDGWLTHWSNAVGLNLTPYFLAWGLTPSQTAISSVSSFPEWNMLHLIGENVTVTAGRSVVLRNPLERSFSYDGVMQNFTVTQPTNGTVTVNGNGTMTYTPNNGYVGSDVISYSVENGLGNVFTATTEVMVMAETVDPKLYTGRVADASTAQWQTITLPEDYKSMVVVASIQTTAEQPPLVARIRHAEGNRFQLKVQRADRGTAVVDGVTVYFVAVEEGVYTKAQHGVNLEAHKVNSSVTDYKGSVAGQKVTLENTPTAFGDFSHTYTMPVVIGQVMSYNDPRWSVFWSDRIGGTHEYLMGKHVGEDPVTARNDEILGVIAMDFGHYQINDVRYWGDSSGMWEPAWPTAGVDDGGGVQQFDSLYRGAYGITSAFPGTRYITENDDLYWPVLFGEAPISSIGVAIALDEDGFADSERSHGNIFGLPFMMFSNVLVTQDDVVETATGTPVEIDVLANDGVRDSELQLTITSYTQPLHGVVVLDDVTQLFTYTPDMAFGGNDRFHYTVQDNSGATSTATVTVKTPRYSSSPDASKLSSELTTKFEGDEIYNGSTWVNGWYEENVDHVSETLQGSELNRTQTGNGAANIRGDNATKGGTTWAAANHGDWTFETRMRINDAPNGMSIWLGTGSQRIVLEIYNDRTQDFGADGFNVAHVNNDGQFHTWRITHDAAFGTYYVWRDELLLTPAPGIAYDLSGGGDDLRIGDYTGGVLGNNQNIDIAYVAYDMTGQYAPSNGAVSPVAMDDTVIMAEDQLAVIDVLTNDLPAVSGETLEIQSVTQGADGVVVNHGTYLTYQPKANYYGADLFTYTIVDAQGETAASTVFVTVNAVNDVPVFTANPLTVEGAVEDELFSGTLAGMATDVESGDQLTYAKVSGPNWLNISMTGVLSGTPRSGDVGHNSFVVAATDMDGGRAEVVLELTVAPTPWTLMADWSFKEGTGTVTVDAKNGYEATLVGTTWHAGYRLGGLAFDGVDDALRLDEQLPWIKSLATVTFSAWIKTAGTGAHAIFTASNTKEGSTEARLFIENGRLRYDFRDQGAEPAAEAGMVVGPVVNDNQWHHISLTVDADQLATLYLDGVAVSAETEPFIAMLSTVDAVNIGCNIDSSGAQWHYAGELDEVLIYNYALTADEIMALYETYNGGPVAVSDTVTLAEDTSATVAVLANDLDPDEDVLSIAAVTQPAQGTVTINGDSILYTPTENYFGADQFTYTVTDGELSATTNVSVMVTAVNDAPVANEDTAQGTEDESLVIDVLANDSDLENDTLSVSSVSNPNHGVALISNGRITYTPNTDFNGLDSFTYTLTDGVDTATALVTLSVNPVNDAPVAMNDTVTMNEDAVVTIQPLLNDTDVDGDQLTIQSVAVPANGSAVLNGQSITYTPHSNYSGVDSFSYTISDGAATAVGTIRIDIAPVNDVPTAGDDKAFTQAAQVVNIDVLVNDTDLDGDTLVISSVTQGAQGSVDLLDNQLVYTPLVDFMVSDTFTYTVSDGNGGSASATVTVYDRDITIDFEANQGFTEQSGINDLITTEDIYGTVWHSTDTAAIWNRSDIPPSGIQCLMLDSNESCQFQISEVYNGIQSLTFDYASFSSRTNTTFTVWYDRLDGHGWQQAWTTEVNGMVQAWNSKPWPQINVDLNLDGPVVLLFQTAGSRGVLIDTVSVTPQP